MGGVWILFGSAHFTAAAGADMVSEQKININFCLVISHHKHYKYEFMYCLYCLFLVKGSIYSKKLRINPCDLNSS